MSFYSPNLVPYFTNVKGTPINGTNVQGGVNGQPVIPTPAIPQMNILQFWQAAQQLQQLQTLETCALCNQPLSMYPIPLEFDNVARKQLYACSEICKNLWQAKKGPSDSSSADSRKRSPPRNQEESKKSNKQGNKKRKKKEKDSQQEKRKDQVDGGRNISEILPSTTENQSNTGAYT